MESQVDQLEPALRRNGLVIYQGDCREVLARLPERSVHCVVTSPPYWNLRDYGVEGQLGMEETPWEYIDNMVEVFSQVHRVLRDNGTLWLNLGDTYCQDDKWGGRSGELHRGVFPRPRKARHSGLKPKDLVGIPWRVAFALQADGWYLRQDNIWHKPSPMPESARDRTTTSHEYLFQFSKSPRYFYDDVATMEPVTGNAHSRGDGVNPKSRVPSGWDTRAGNHREKTGRYPTPKQNESFAAAVNELVTTRKKRSVWTIAAVPFKGAHFATFPPDLVTPCILAGTSERGCCPMCGAPYERLTEKTRRPTRPGRDNVNDQTGMANRDSQRHVTDIVTIGWEPPCDCHKQGEKPSDFATFTRGWYSANLHAIPDNCTVLDPFCGTGTVGQVARQYGRDFIGVELSQEYIDKHCGRRFQQERMF